jgi:hypothetical protein
MVQNLSDVTHAITDQIDRLNSSESRFRTAEEPGAQGDGETPDKSNAGAAPPADDAGAHEEARVQDSEEPGAMTTGDEGEEAPLGQRCCPRGPSLLCFVVCADVYNDDRVFVDDKL